MVRESLGRVSDWLDSLYRVYVEDGEVVRLAHDEIEVCRSWYGDRRVGADEVAGYLVATSFLCVRWGSEDPPMVFETLVTGLGEERKWRYASRKLAREGHDRIVQLLGSGVLLSEVK